VGVMAKTVVLVIDMLRGFLEEGYPLFCGHESRKIIPRVIKLLNDLEEKEIIYICDSHQQDDPEFKLWPHHCISGSKEAELIEELQAYPGRIIPKRRYSGFFGTELDKILEEIDPEKVIVVGVCTDICVLHTVADLRNRDYNVEVPRDCVSTFDMEAHNFALNHMEKILGARIT